MKALLLHAHPDDELLFAGALLLSRDWDWTLVCMTGERPYRGINLGLDGDWQLLSFADFYRWRAAVHGLNLQPDIVITHNRLGEYGHPHHMAVHCIAHQLYRRVWDFYVTAPSTVGPQVRGRNVTAIVPTEAKRELFISTYGQAVYDALEADHPAMVHELFNVAERFTGPGALPE